MRYFELLLEYNIPRIINDFGKKLESRYKFEFGKNLSADQIIKLIEPYDPTKNKEYMFWLCRMYANYDPEKNIGIARFEDIGSKAAEALEKYQKLKISKKLNPEQRDINRIPSLSALMDINDQYPDITSNREADLNLETEFYKTKQATLIYNDAQIKVVIPHTEQASCYFGRNTRWCTAAKHNNEFENYNKKGELYIVLIKPLNQRYQFNFESSQFMDELDEPINPMDLADKYPKLWDIFDPIAKQKHSIILDKSVSSNKQKRDEINNVIQYGVGIKNIQNPSEDIQMIAVRNNGYAIRYIKNPPERVQIAAVQQLPSAIEYINNPSENVQMIAVTHDGHNLNYIKNPTEKVQLAAVEQYAPAIRNIKNPSEALQLAVVNQYGYDIEFINNPSEQVQLAAVKQNGRAIKYIKNPSELVQLLAVKTSPIAINYIKNPTEKVKLAARQ